MIIRLGWAEPGRYPGLSRNSVDHPATVRGSAGAAGRDKTGSLDQGPAFPAADGWHEGLGGRHHAAVQGNRLAADYRAI